MDIHVIEPHQITEAQRALWVSMMTVQQTTDSPFFHPEYAAAIGGFRKQVRVAVVTEQSQPVA
ncbi:hypothetical protein MNBD_PLANCTO02-1030, partial [hydrothermal vent metagenome]